VDAQKLPALMPDLREASTRCRFYNCTHRQEPGCGVREALAQGAISESRYRIYGEIHQELEGTRW
jgi:ribosome biogenesis GTPase